MTDLSMIIPYESTLRRGRVGSLRALRHRASGEENENLDKPIDRKERSQKLETLSGRKAGRQAGRQAGRL